MTLPLRLTRAFIVSVALTAPALMASHAAADTLRAVPHAQLEVLDPIWTTAYITRSHGYLVYDTLFGLDESLEPQPQMVDTWSVSEDELSWSFTLRPDQKWHDGTEVTAADAVASLRRWGARDGEGQSLFSRITAIEAESDDTFTMTLSRSYPWMLDTLGKMSSNVPFIMPEHIAETDPNEAITDPIGSGPYRFSTEEWEPGERVVYVRNELYVPRDEPTSLAAGAKTASLERIEWITFDDQDQAIEALLNDDVHYLESPSTSRVERLAERDDIVVAVTDPTGNIGMAVFNHAIAPFDDVEMRRAVIAGMNQKDYMRAALGDATTPEGEPYWQTCASIYPCGTSYSTPVADSSFVSGDLDAARAMLEASDYDGSPVVILDPVDSPVISAFTGVTLELFQDMGIAVDHQEMTWAELVQRRVVRTQEDGEVWNMFHTWWIAADVDDPLKIAFSGDPASGWIGWPEDPELEARRTAYLDAETSEDFPELAAQIQQRIVDNANFAILGQFFEPIAFHISVQGTQRPIQMYYNLSLAPQG
ncbi:MAG: ABC transporter substrate-binding protein [bacterium]